MHGQRAASPERRDDGAGDEPSAAARRPRLLDEIRRCIRYRHYSYRMEQAYVELTRRFVRFHGRRHPHAMGGGELVLFLDHPANERDVSASTHDQALPALLDLYCDDARHRVAAPRAAFAIVSRR